MESFTKARSKAFKSDEYNVYKKNYVSKSQYLAHAIFSSIDKAKKIPV